MFFTVKSALKRCKTTLTSLLSSRLLGDCLNVSAQTPQPKLEKDSTINSSGSNGTDKSETDSNPKHAMTGSDAVGAPATAPEGGELKTAVAAAPAAAAPPVDATGATTAAAAASTGAAAAAAPVTAVAVVHAAAGAGPAAAGAVAAGSAAAPTASTAAAPAWAAEAAAPPSADVVDGVATPGAAATAAPTAAASGRVKGSGAASRGGASGGEVPRKTSRPRLAMPRVTSERSQRKMLMVSRGGFGRNCL